MSNRPNYVLKLADGTERVFTPIGEEAWQTKDGYFFTAKTLEALGATPVPQEEPKVKCYFHFVHGLYSLAVPILSMHFKSHEDAENYRLRCESIGPEWTDWEPNDGDSYWLDVDGEFQTWPYDSTCLGDVTARLSGRVHQTEERRQEWLDKYGKAWGLK